MSAPARQTQVFRIDFRAPTETGYTRTRVTAMPLWIERRDDGSIKRLGLVECERLFIKVENDDLIFLSVGEPRDESCARLWIHVRIRDGRLSLKDEDILDARECDDEDDEMINAWYQLAKPSPADMAAADELFSAEKAKLKDALRAVIVSQLGDGANPKALFTEAATLLRLFANQFEDVAFRMEWERLHG